MPWRRGCFVASGWPLLFGLCACGPVAPVAATGAGSGTGSDGSTDASITSGADHDATTEPTADETGTATTDTDGTTGTAPQCGNGIIDGLEECDGRLEATCMD